jgi:cyclase
MSGRVMTQSGRARVLVLGVIALLAVAAFGVARLRMRPRGPSFPPVGPIEKVADNLYVVPGAGGNTAVFLIESGVVLVDTKVANQGQAILDQVKTVTEKPITHIINTHSHGDHNGSNAFFPSQVEIVAHEATAANMAEMSVFWFGLKKSAMPDTTFTDRLTLFSGKDAIDLYFFGPAHTRGDAFIVFRALRAMHAGDVFPGKETPRMDVDRGGSAVGFPAAVTAAAERITDVDIVIPGHSAVTTWNDFVEYGEFSRAFLEATRARKKAGDTAEQAAATLALPEKFKNYDLSNLAINVARTYAELPPAP